jgi:hypothetical protein
MTMEQADVQENNTVIRREFLVLHSINPVKHRDYHMHHLL